jgi:hypothetical protein
MLKSITDKLRAVSSSILLLDDTPSEQDIEKLRKLSIKPGLGSGTNPFAQINTEGQGSKNTSQSQSQHRNTQEDPEREIRQTKRPSIKAPRREQAYKTKWLGDGAKDVRNDYQKEYRMNNGDK